MVHSKFFEEPLWGLVYPQKHPVNSQVTWSATYDEIVAKRAELGVDLLTAHSFANSEYFCLDYDCHNREFTAEELEEIETLKEILSWDRGTSGKGYHFYSVKFETVKAVRNKTHKADVNPEVFWDGNFYVIVPPDYTEVDHELNGLDKKYLTGILERVEAFYTEEETKYKSAHNKELKNLEWGDVTINVDDYSDLVASTHEKYEKSQDASVKLYGVACKIARGLPEEHRTPANIWELLQKTECFQKFYVSWGHKMHNLKALLTCGKAAKVEDAKVTLTSGEWGKKFLAMTPQERLNEWKTDFGKLYACEPEAKMLMLAQNITPLLAVGCTMNTQMYGVAESGKTVFYRAAEVMCGNRYARYTDDEGTVRLVKSRAVILMELTTKVLFRMNKMVGVGTTLVTDEAFPEYLINLYKQTYGGEPYVEALTDPDNPKEGVLVTTPARVQWGIAYVDPQTFYATQTDQFVSRTMYHKMEANPEKLKLIEDIKERRYNGEFTDAEKNELRDKWNDIWDTIMKVGGINEDGYTNISVPKAGDFFAAHIKHNMGDRRDDAFRSIVLSLHIFTHINEQGEVPELDSASVNAAIRILKACPIPTEPHSRGEVKERYGEGVMKFFDELKVDTYTIDFVAEKLRAIMLTKIGKMDSVQHIRRKILGEKATNTTRARAGMISFGFGLTLGGYLNPLDGDPTRTLVWSGWTDESDVEEEVVYTP